MPLQCNTFKFIIPVICSVLTAKMYQLEKKQYFYASIATTELYPRYFMDLCQGKWNKLFLLIGRIEKMNNCRRMSERMYFYLGFIA